MHEVQTDEGVGICDFLLEARLKLTSLANPSSVAKGDSFLPAGGSPKVCRRFRFSVKHDIIDKTRRSLPL